MIELSRKSQGGFLLVTMVIVLGVLGAIALALSGSASMDNALLAKHADGATLDYVAESGLEHAQWRLSQNTSCTGYTGLPATSFGANSYSASFSPSDGSPVTIIGTGSVPSGATRELIQNGVQAFQVPQSITLQPGPESKDAWITSGKTTWNYGAHGSLNVNSTNQRALLQFDLAAVPANARITSAVVELYPKFSSESGNVAVHRVTGDWVEGSCAGAGCAADGATWDTSDGIVFWATPGTDHDPDPVADLVIGAADTWQGWDITSLAASWHTGELLNQGIVLVGANGASSQFLSSDDSDPTRRPRLMISYACECGNICGASGASGKLLLVVGDAGTLASKDANRKIQFELWDYAVTIIDDDADQTTFDTEAAASDVIYVSGTISAAVLPNKLDDSVTPIVNEDTFMATEFGFSDAEGNSIASDNFSVTEALHYISKPFGGNAVTVFDSSLTIDAASGNLAPGLQSVAEVTVGVPSLAALAVGALQWDGTLTMARRVHVPFESAETSQLTADGLTLMRRAIEWAAGSGCDSYYPLAMVVGDASNPSTDENARNDLLATWCYAVTLMTASEPEASYDQLAVDFDIVYVPSTVSHSDVTDKLKFQQIGIVNEVSALSPYLGFTSASSSLFGNATTIVDDTHFITSTFGTGDIAITSSSQPLHQLVNTIGSGIHTLSTRPATTDRMLMTLEAGDVMVFGSIAPDRRVMLPWGGVAFDVNALTVEGRVLLQKALIWASGVAGGGSSCPVDIIPDTKESEFSTDSLDISDPRGITFLAAGTSFNGVNVPVDGAWLLVDGSDRDFILVDLSGAILTTKSIPLSEPRGVTYIGSGTWGQHLALADPSDMRIYFLDMNGVVQGSISTVGITEHPVGVTIIENSVGGLYDDHFAISSDKDGSGGTSAGIYVVDQDGNLEVSIDVSDFAAEPWGIAHIPDKEKFLLVDESGIVTIVGFDGTLHDQYNVAAFGGTQPQSIAINPLTSAHVVLDKDTGAVMTLVSSTCDSEGSCGGSFRDEFETISYSNNDGTVTWSTDWLEINESDGPDDGDEWIDDEGEGEGEEEEDDSYHLVVKDNDGGGEGVQREADLFASASATLSFYYQRIKLDDSSDFVTVDVSNDGGSTWVELDRFSGPGTDSTYVPVSYDISAYIATNTRIRFLTSPSLGRNDELYFDDVEIELTGCAGN